MPQLSEDTHQLATPISLANSYTEEGSEPGNETTHNNPNQTENLLLTEKHRLLVSDREEELEDTTSLPDRLTNQNTVTSFNFEAHEDDLSVWGYMISNDYEKLSFLLSKESRCGKKKQETVDRSKSSTANQAGAVILKDYNGDNLASSGYLIGEHEECDVVIQHPDVCPRHCVIFKIHNQTRADSNDAHYDIYVQDISGQGTIINGSSLKQNDVQLLNDGDVLALSNEGPSWTYKRTHATSGRSFDQRFTRGKSLGKGHFAEVFEITDARTKQSFAAKQILKRPGRSAASFLAEIGVLMSCTHPGITCIRDVFDVPDAVYLVLEYAAGGELFDRIIQKGKFTEAETRLIFRQIFGALNYLHARSIVHRDIKPENILLKSSGLDIRLADFGLARIVDHNGAQSTLAGTPSYIPPEMLRPTKTPGESLQYTDKVDSWSAGVVLYICLCGFPPFSNELAPPSMKTQIREGSFTFTRPYWDSISNGAMDLVQKLLTVDVQSRYSVQQALDHAWLKGSLESDSELSEAPKHRRGLKRQRTMLQDIGR